MGLSLVILCISQRPFRASNGVEAARFRACTGMQQMDKVKR